MWLDLLPQHISCGGERPSNINELVDLAQQLNFQSFQFSYKDVDGQVYHCAVGWAALSPWPTPMRIDHKMRYASLSKIFTSAVAVQLSSEGLDFDARVVEPLRLDHPPIDKRVNDITVGHLLNHTAGFDRTTGFDPMMVKNPWCPFRTQFLADLRLHHVPGEVYVYSNLGYCLLGEVIARHEQAPLDRVFQKRLFSPLGLKAVFPLKTNQRLRDSPQHFFDSGESMADLLSVNYSAMLASGAWAGSARDFLLLMTHLFGPEATLLSDDQQGALLETAAGCDISIWRKCHGRGFYKYREPNSKTMYWRDASLPGVTGFAALTDDGAALVMLTHYRNVDWMLTNDLLGKGLYRWLQK